MKTVAFAYPFIRCHMIIKITDTKKRTLKKRDRAIFLRQAFFKEIERKKVDHFSIVGGGDYKVELCIYLAEEDD